MDEILDMIEHEQREREMKGGSQDDDEDDKNIDEIMAFINKQQPPPQFGNDLESEYVLPEEAEAEFEAMLAMQNQGMPEPVFMTPVYQPAPNDLLDGMHKLSLKTLSAGSAPFIPRTTQ